MSSTFGFLFSCLNISLTGPRVCSACLHFISSLLTHQKSLKQSSRLFSFPIDFENQQDLQSLLFLFFVFFINFSLILVKSLSTDFESLLWTLQSFLCCQTFLLQAFPLQTIECIICALNVIGFVLGWLAASSCCQFKNATVLYSLALSCHGLTTLSVMRSMYLSVFQQVVAPRDTRGIYSGFTNLLNAGLFLAFILVYWTFGFSHRTAWMNLSYLLTVTATLSYLCVLHLLEISMVTLGPQDDHDTKFVRFISHELRSHLSHLAMGLQMVCEEIKPDDIQTRKLLSELQDSCDSAVQILSDILVVNRLQLSERLAVSKSLLPVSQMVIEALDGESSKAREKLCELSIDSHGAFVERSVSSTESNLDGNINLKDTPVLHVSSFEVVHAVKFLLRQAIKCSPPGTTVSFRSFLKFHETNPSVRNAVTAGTAVDDVEGVGGGGSAGQVSSIPGSDSPRVRPSRIAPEPLFESESESGRGTDPNRVASNVSNKRLDSLRLSIGSAVSTVSALRKSLLGSISSRSSAISGRSRHRPPAPSRVLVRDPERGDLWLEETGRLVLEVTDKGMGMSAADQKSLFASTGTGTFDALLGGQGSGLGISVMKMMITRNGGSVRVFSAGRKKGTTFTVELPVFRISPESNPAGMMALIFSGSPPREEQSPKALSSSSSKASMVNSSSDHMGLIATASDLTNSVTPSAARPGFAGGPAPASSAIVHPHYGLQSIPEFESFASSRGLEGFSFHPEQEDFPPSEHRPHPFNFRATHPPAGSPLAFTNNENVTSEDNRSGENSIEVKSWNFRDWLLRGEGSRMRTRNSEVSSRSSGDVSTSMRVRVGQRSESDSSRDVSITSREFSFRLVQPNPSLQSPQQQQQLSSLTHVISSLPYPRSVSVPPKLPPRYCTLAFDSADIVSSVEAMRSSSHSETVKTAATVRVFAKVQNSLVDLDCIYSLDSTPPPPEELAVALQSISNSREGWVNTGKAESTLQDSDVLFSEHTFATTTTARSKDDPENRLLSMKSDVTTAALTSASPVPSPVPLAVPVSSSFSTAADEGIRQPDIAIPASVNAGTFRLCIPLCSVDGVVMAAVCISIPVKKGTEVSAQDHHSLTVLSTRLRSLLESSLSLQDSSHSRSSWSSSVSVGGAGVGNRIGGGVLHRGRVAILLVDDVKTNRQILRKLVELLGQFHIEEASDGSDCLRKAAERENTTGRSFDVIFLDCLMPVMDGPTAALKLVANGYSGEIIGFSGMHSLALSAFQSSGVSKVLQKPLLKSDVKKVLQGATRRSFSTGDGDTRLALLAADDAIENSLSSRLSSQRMAFQDASFLPLKEERGGAGGRTHEEGEEKCSQEEAHVLVRNISIGRHAGSSPTDFALARSVKPPFFHFLVVDDIASNRSIVSRLLLGLGHSVVEADDGEEAMLKFGQSLQPTGGAASEPPVSQFDCIFIDNVMPHKDGPTATREIRALGYRGPIFGVTGSVLQFDVDHFLACGVDRVLAKPLRKEIIENIVEELVQSKGVVADDLAALVVAEDVSAYPTGGSGSENATVSTSVDTARTSSVRMPSLQDPTSILPMSRLQKDPQKPMGVHLHCQEGSALGTGSNAGIPTEQASMSPSMLPSTSQSEKKQKQAQFRFLVVDDVQSNRRIISMMLRKLNHVVVEAEDGVEAVQLVEKTLVRGDNTAATAEGIGNDDELETGSGTFDCILMDFVMPHMDGPTATKEIRALGYHSPIIGVTGNVLQFDVDHFLACGADRVVAKPLRKEGIESILEDVAARKISVRTSH